MVVIAGFGNPLLDIIVTINCKQLLQKYNLKEDDQKEVDDITMQSLLQDIKNLATEYAPGGSVQNTLRIFQWLCGKTETTYMIGGIGNDENGIILKELVENAGVTTIYHQNNEVPTGITVAITNQENRSLVASIGAAKEFSIESLNKIDNDDLMNYVDLFYMEGFFIPNREIFTKHITEYSRNKNKLFAFNISAPYICQENCNIKYLVENCDILFGNMKEYEALSQTMNFSGNVLDLARSISNSNINKNWKYEKMVIITNGSRNVTCVYNKKEVVEMEVPKLLPHELQDTTGAGDSFVAGFLFGLFKNYTPDICLKHGCWAAQQIIRQVGCKVPDYLPEIDKILM